MQLSLFDDGAWTKKNIIIGRILALDFQDALNKIDELNYHYPLYDIQTEHSICTYLLPTQMYNNIETSLNLWNSLEASGEVNKQRYFKDFKRNFFDCLCNTIKNTPYESDYISGIPAGVIFMEAGRLKEARVSLEKTIAKYPANPDLFASLGDVHYLCDDTHASGICYREAFELNPSDIDVETIKAPYVQKLIQEVRGFYPDSPHYYLWIASIGCIRQSFPFKTIKEHESIRKYVSQFGQLRIAYSQSRAPESAAQLFYKALVLSESAKYVKNFDNVDVHTFRSVMKDIEPDLFEEYMEIKT